MVVNGAKTFITNGELADFVMVACKTDPNAGAKGVSLVMVETERAGFSRGKKLEKMGEKAQDVAELFFDDVRVTEVAISRTFADKCLELHLEGKLDVPTAAGAKFWMTELEQKVLDTCLQFFGGYGYMVEFPISRAYTNARVHRIYAGTNEIMREIVARSL